MSDNADLPPTTWRHDNTGEVQAMSDDREGVADEATCLHCGHPPAMHGDNGVCTCGCTAQLHEYRLRAASDEREGESLLDVPQPTSRTVFKLGSVMFLLGVFIGCTTALIHTWMTDNPWDFWYALAGVLIVAGLICVEIVKR